MNKSGTASLGNGVVDEGDRATFMVVVIGTLQLQRGIARFEENRVCLVPTAFTASTFAAVKNAVVDEFHDFIVTGSASAELTSFVHGWWLESE